MKFTFKIWEKIKEAWSLYKNNLLQFSTISIFCVFVFYLDEYVLTNIVGGSIILSILASLFILLVASFLLYVLVNFIDSLLKKNDIKLSTKEIFSRFSGFLNFFALVFLGDLVITFCMVAPAIIGSFLRFSETASIEYYFFFEPLLWVFLLILMIYLFTRLVFSVFIMSEKKQNVFKSIKESWNITKGYAWKFLWRFLLLEIIIVNLVFLRLPVFLGVPELSLVFMFILIPLCVIFLFVLYRDFSNFKQNNLIPPVKEGLKEEAKEEVVKDLPKENIKKEEAIEEETIENTEEGGKEDILKEEKE